MSTINEILKSTQHRPWDMPLGGWSFYQEWNDAIFLHYQVEIEELQKFVPDSLEIDLFEGQAWVSVVAFTMEKIRPRYLPYFPPISNFEEINIRTYVKSNNKTGVYFLSIEGGKKLSCKISKAISELPYRFSHTKRTSNTYESQNSDYDDTLNINFTIGEQVKGKKDIDIWLTERYALFQDAKNAINQFEIHHLEWPVFNIQINNLEVNYPRFNKLLNEKPNKFHYSPGVKVMAWNKIKRYP